MIDGSWFMVPRCKGEYIEPPQTRVYRTAKILAMGWRRLEMPEDRQCNDHDHGMAEMPEDLES